MRSPFDTPGSGPAGRLHLPYNTMVVVIAALCIVLVGHDLFRTWHDRSRRIDESSRQVTNLVLAADQHAQDAFQLADITLGALVDRLETDGTGPVQLERLRRVMAERLASLPVLLTLDVMDETGVPIADSHPIPPGSNLAYREYFQHHMTHSDREPYVSPVIRARGSGKMVVVLSRRFNYANGGFAGVAAATIDVAYFLGFYATFDLGHDGSAALLRDDGTLLVRLPPAASAIGTRRLHVPPFNDPLSKATSGLTELRSPLDDVVRIYAWRRMAGYPLVVGVALGKDEQLAVWRVGAAEHGLATVAVALLLGFIGVRLVLQVRLLKQAERITAAANATAKRAAAQYSLLADNASEMIVVIHPQLLQSYVSPGCRNLIGYEPAELVGQSPLSLVHPEDAERFTECLHDLIAGRAHDCMTYRIRHRDGHWVWVEISLKLIRNPDSGAPQEICGTLRDVSERMESLATLQNSEERFRLVLQSNAVTEAIFMLDPDGIIESWNAAAERIKGYRPAEIIGRNFSVFFTPEDIASGEPARTLASARESGTFATEAWRVRKDGSRFLAHVIITAIRNRDGGLRGYVKATRDITDQRIEEEQRRIIIEAAPNGMLIVDEAGVITLANSQLERIFGYPQGTLIGQPIEILVPDGFHVAQDGPSPAFTSGPSDKGTAPPRQLAGRRRDGSVVTIEIMLSPVATPRGRIVVAALFDITDRVHLAAVLQESEDRKRAETAATNQTNLLASETALASSQAETKVGRANLLASETALASSQAETKVGQTNLLASETALASSQAETKVGKTNLLASETANTDLEILARELGRARDCAEKANRAKSRFLAGMSHELRTPLNGILGYAHLLHIEGGLKPAQAARVDAMLDAGKHLLEMITCILDLSEIEANHLLLRSVELDVQAIALACLDLVRPMAEAKGLALSVTAAPGTSSVLVADPTRLRQILLNLLGNAAKFTRQGAVQVHLRKLADGSALRIEVADTGPGVAADQRHRLFQDFERMDTDVTRIVEGAGLGLALSARLAGLMGGGLGYDDNPDGGSIFWLELPLDVVAVSAPVTAPDVDMPAVAAILEPARAFHVLVVDDVLMNRNIAGSFLRAAGHTVVCVESGPEAIAAVVGPNVPANPKFAADPGSAPTDAFDVVLMDVRMPGMDGLEATRRIRALPGLRGQVPIVALTAQAFTEQVAECRAAGMDSHLSKPFDPAALIAAVAQAVAAGRTQQSAGHRERPVPPNRQTARAADRSAGQGVAPKARSRPGSHAVPAAPAAIPVIGSELSIVDLTVFERTTSFLPPETIALHLKTIVELASDLLRRLRLPGAGAPSSRTEMTDAVHGLAGSAGMFGFQRLAAIGRRFEHAVQNDAADAPALADALVATLEATLLAIHDLRPAAADA